MTRLGVTLSAVDQTLYDAFGQRQVATIYTDLDQFKVVLEVDPHFRGHRGPSSLNRIFVPGTSSAQVPLSFLVRTGAGPGTGPAQPSERQLPAITISFNTKRPGVAIGDAMAAINRASEAAAVFPEGVTGSASRAMPATLRIPTARHAAAADRAPWSRSMSCSACSTRAMPIR